MDEIRTIDGAGCLLESIVVFGMAAVAIYESKTSSRLPSVYYVRG